MHVFTVHPCHLLALSPVQSWDRLGTRLSTCFIKPCQSADGYFCMHNMLCPSFASSVLTSLSTAGSDYSSISQDLTFNQNNVRFLLNIQILGDGTNEPVEFFEVDLSTTDTDATLDPLSTTITINDNDRKNPSC